jgi:competence protein ComEC
MPLLEAVSAPYSRALRSINRMNADPYLPPRAAQFRIEIRLAAETLHFWTRVPAAWAAQLLALALRAVFFAFDMAVISTVVQVGLALPMAEYFHRISLTGLTANLLIVPMMEWVVPLGFVAIFTGWHWVGWLAGRLVAISARVANWHAALEPSWRVADPPVWLAACFVAVLVASAIAWRHRILRIPAAALLVALFTLLLWHPWPPNLEPGLLELTSIDVGQGDSLLVVLPRGEIMLVDGGGILRYGRAHKSNLDIGEDVVSPYLWSRGIRRVDVVVATHAHEDHIGGIPALLENFRPRELWTGANPQPAMLEQAARLGIRVIEQTAGPAFDLSGATLQVLAPLADYRSSRPGNNDSLALRIAYGARSLLLTGDLERPIEARLLSAGEVQSADILKVGHHGSKTSTIQPFLDAVSPSIAVISAGFENSFGHPHPDVLARLNARHTAILRTDQSGLVTVLTDGQRVWFDTRRAEASSGFARLWALNSSGDWTQY